ncbi:hypothetical protein [Longispora urticae]
MTMTEEDLMFDLDLRVVPVDARDDYNRNPGMSEGCVHTSYVTEGCPWSRGGCSYTCTRNVAAGGNAQHMCL